MAFTIIASASTKQTPGTTPAINTTGANLIIVAFAIYNGNTHPPSFSDSASNTWPSPFLSTIETTRGNGQFGYMIALSSPTTSASHTFTNSSNANSSFAVLAVSGAASSSPLDQTNNTLYVTGSPTTEATGSVTPTQNNELCVAAWCTDTPTGNTYSVDSGYTIQQQIDDSPNSYFGIVLATLIQTTAAATNPSLTRLALTGGDIAMIATFKTPGSSTPTLGWYTRSYDDRWPFQRKPDDAAAFVSPPFPFVKPPSVWLPKVMDGGERPILMRRNDDGVPFLLPPRPIWLPRIDGGERPKRIDPAPEQASFVRAAPTLWIPRSETGERPSSAPDRYGVSWPQQAPSVVNTISGMAWNLPQEGMRPPPPPDRYGVPWPPQVSAAVNTISGIAWWRQADDSRRPPPPGDEREAFVPPVVSTPAVLTWRPAAPDQPFVRPVADQYQPQAFIEAPAVLSGWLVARDQPVPGAKADQYVSPFSLPPPGVGVSGIAWWQPVEVHIRPPPTDQYQQTILLKPAAVLNTNAGIPWWQAIEVHLGPLPPQLDYHPSWDPQFIVQIIPPPPNPAQFTVSGSGVSLIYAEFFVDVVLTDAPMTKRTN